MTHTITCWSEKGSLRIIIGTSTTLAYSIMPAHCQMVVCVCGSSWDTHHGTRGATISMLSGGAATCDKRSSCDERLCVRIDMDIECLPEKRRSARVELWRAASGRMIPGIEMNGTVRGAVEEIHLCINLRGNDALFAESMQSSLQLQVILKTASTAWQWKPSRCPKCK